MFGSDFLFGVSLSGFQFEMGQASEASIYKDSDWYVWVHNKQNIENGIVSGDFPDNGPDYWGNFEQFHRLAAEAGMSIIRIGLEWARLFPEPTHGIDKNSLVESFNSGIIENYRKIMKSIRSHGMKVMVNLNHFSLPLWLHDPLKVNRHMDLSLPGWIDTRIVEEFGKLAFFCGNVFGDLVDFWSTENEPNIVAYLGYNNRSSGFPPSIIRPEMSKMAIDNLIAAHVQAYYELKKVTDVPIGLIYAFSWIDGPENVAKKAIQETQFDFIDRIIDKTDFIGVNYYSRAVVESDQSDERGYRFLKGYGQNCEPNSLSKSGRQTSDFGWEIYPEGLYNIAKAVCSRYNKPVIITENGIADKLDRYRPYYLLAHLNVIERLVEEGYDIRGYLHWSLTDNFEWAAGFSQRFGLVGVDFSDGLLTPRPSYYFFKELIGKRTTACFLKMLKQPYDIFDEENLK